MNEAKKDDGLIKWLMKGSIRLPSPADATGIYLLYQRDEVVYVGQSVKVYTRLIDHCERIDYDYARFCPIEKGDLNSAELEFIIHFNPKHNKQLPKNQYYVTEASAHIMLTRSGYGMIDASLTLNTCKKVTILNKVYYLREEVESKRKPA